MLKKPLFWGIATLICLICTVGLRLAMDRQTVDYVEVSVVVKNSETRYSKVGKSRMSTKVVTVEYMGKTRKLENVHSSAAYIRGKTVKAYLSNNKLYANVEGITSTTPLAKLYFVFLFSNFGLVIIWLSLWESARKAKKLSAGQPLQNSGNNLQ